MKGGPEGEQRSGDAAGGVRPAFAASAAHDDLDGRGFSPTDVFAESLRGSGGANFSSASSYFKVLGGFFRRGPPKPGEPDVVAVEGVALTDYPLRAELG